MLILVIGLIKAYNRYKMTCVKEQKPHLKNIAAIKQNRYKAIIRQKAFFPKPAHQSYRLQ
ncbi:hypothetical protein BGI35_02060 [Snodgrassella communis]|nr:hypothetical protein BGI31_10030 [Snodgrassella communis]PIT23160.1 hypothetical protein BGI35_02060 [Snodgrassella communis]